MGIYPHQRKKGERALGRRSPRMRTARVRKAEGNKADAKQKMQESADKDSENEKPAVTKLLAAEGKTG